MNIGAALKRKCENAATGWSDFLGSNEYPYSS